MLERGNGKSCIFPEDVRIIKGRTQGSPLRPHKINICHINLLSSAFEPVNGYILRSLTLDGRAETGNKTDNSARSVSKEIWALIFLFIAIFSGGSLVFFHPSDKLFWNVTGPLGKANNPFGSVGAHLAGGVYFLFGFSSFWLVIILLAMSILFFSGRTIPSPVKSFLASFALVVSFSAILGLQFPDVIHVRSGDMFAGGIIGLHLASLTKDVLNYFGAYLLFFVIFIISLMVLTSISLGGIISRLGILVILLLKQISGAFNKRKERKKRARNSIIVRKEIRAKPKVQIIAPEAEEEKKPEQNVFSFMNRADEIQLPSIDLLNDPPDKTNTVVQRESLEMNARLLEKRLKDFAVKGEVSAIHPGPVITMYEYKPAPGIKISKIVGLSDDLALALRAPSIRIVAPIPGKAAVGIEIPNNRREPVFLKEIISSSQFKNTKFDLPVTLGKDITGIPVIADLAKMPHLLVAGATGAGKSVSINTMINSLLFKVSPDMVRFLIIDPKRIELSIYRDIPYLLHPVVTEPKNATRALRWAVSEMERRYMLLSDRGVRNIKSYNAKILKDRKAAIKQGTEGIDGKPLPFIVIIIDELADLMMVSSKEVEETITRLAQMARAAGIHLVIATQRPSVDVLTGIIKANFPTRISFQVSSKVDSRTILDTMGAENLLGEGDMLFMPPGVGRIKRIHGAFVSEDEVRRVTDFVRAQKKPEYDNSIRAEISRDEESEDKERELDEKYGEALEIVFQTGHASISSLQRRLRVGYNRAARMIEAMEKEGVVGPSDGVRPRVVYAGRRT
ncbi:MAG: DNA translocase FtsK 4TM domain-containing protein [Deltaproteobacteria bacterium]|nr:DNA translocase FtsK 4TM domain-containing protein [Deltaproteobacteria bacterium]